MAILGFCPDPTFPYHLKEVLVSFVFIARVDIELHIDLIAAITIMIRTSVSS
jgi:hypothetical protein